MATEIRTELNEQGRGIVGGLLVAGLAFFYTMETWWWGWTLPLVHLLTYTVSGLAVVLVVTRQVGFRRGYTDGNGAGYLLTEFTELVLQSLLAAAIVLVTFGVVDAGTERHVVVRLLMIQVVPVALGAALANRLLAGSEAESGPEMQFPSNLAVFALGAAFLTIPIAPTQEMALLAAHMTWLNVLALLGLSLTVVHLTLYELEFQQQQMRALDVLRYELGTSATAYVVAFGVTAFLLWGFGQFSEVTVAIAVEKTVILSFPAAAGAAGAEVVL